VISPGGRSRSLLPTSSSALACSRNAPCNNRAAVTRIVTIAVTLCSFLLLSGDAGLAKDVTGSDPIVMTYWEAKEAGYHVPLLPSETGMRVCTEADFHPGFPSAEALEKSLREYEAKWGEAGSPGDCQVDPTKASIIFLGSTGGLSALTPPAERPAP
jgi:hypothetical protein